VLYQHYRPVPVFRLLLALESALIIETWKGASEAAPVAAEGRPSSPLLAARRARVAGEITCLAACRKHLLLGNALDGSDSATTSQGRLGSQAPQQIQV